MMRNLLTQLILSGLLLATFLGTGCSSESDTGESSDQAEDTLSVAIEDPVREERVMNDFAEVELLKEGLPFSIQLPEDVVVKDRDNGTVWVLLNESEDFKLIVEAGRFDLEQIAQYWRESPEGYAFRDMLLETPNEIMFEVSHNGAIEYHVDAVFRGAEFLRLYSAKDRPFSRYQAERMFHACRTIKPLETQEPAARE